LPGLPKRKTGASAVAGTLPPVNTNGFPTGFLYVRGTQDVAIPSWVQYCRISAVGSGGKGYVYANYGGGGGGGGFTGTNAVPVPLQSVISIKFNANNITITGLGYTMVAGFGANANGATGGVGGGGAGGDVNFTGGSGGNGSSTGSYNHAGGGGAASRGGNGSAGTAPTTSYNGQGGDGGPKSGWISGGAPGGYGGSNTGIKWPDGFNGYTQLSAGPLLAMGGRSYDYPDLYNGSDGGGGSGGVPVASYGNTPGSGLVLLEYW
jgi:hypothetical protein